VAGCRRERPAAEAYGIVEPAAGAEPAGMREIGGERCGRTIRGDAGCRRGGALVRGVHGG